MFLSRCFQLSVSILPCVYIFVGGFGVIVAFFPIVDFLFFFWAIISLPIPSLRIKAARLMRHELSFLSFLPRILGSFSSLISLWRFFVTLMDMPNGNETLL